MFELTGVLLGFVGIVWGIRGHYGALHSVQSLGTTCIDSREIYYYYYYSMALSLMSLPPLFFYYHYGICFSLLEQFWGSTSSSMSIQGSPNNRERTPRDRDNSLFYLPQARASGQYQHCKTQCLFSPHERLFDIKAASYDSEVIVLVIKKKRGQPDDCIISFV